MVSDNNFNEAQFTQFLGFSLDGDILDVEVDSLLSIENLAGSEVNDFLSGDEGNNVLVGNGGDDQLAGNGGINVLFGGDGIDTAAFAGNQADFDIAVAEDGSISVANLAAGIDDALVDIEFLSFADGVVDVATIDDGDDPTPEAPQATNAITLEVAGTFQTGIFDESAAEIVAFDPESDSLFVINADANVIDILDIADPTAPTLVQSIGLGEGGVNSVSVSNGIVAAAVANEDDTAAGSVVFLDTDGNILNTVEVGVLPDSVAFSADGSFAVVANEAEPVDLDGDDIFDVNPEGSISVINLANGVENATVATADFTAFNGSEVDLVGDGVRIFPGLTAAEDLEPEFVAIAPNGTQAFVTLQENNAVALVDLNDLANPSVTDILPLGVTDFSQGLPTLEGLFDVPLETEEFQIGTDADGNPIFLGGLSSLSFDGLSEAGNPLFLAINDRGPVNGTIATDDPDSSDRPFITPDLQVTVLTLELDEAAGTVTVVDSLGLTRDEGGESLPITGLTNIPGFFEVPLDAATGEPIANDPFGLDSEGIIRDPNTGNLFVVDEGAPSIAVFSPEGVLIDRFVPIGYADQGDDPDAGLDFTAGDFGTETLPEVYLERRNNRGFEAVAFDPEAGENGILYAFIQTPQSNPDTATSNASSVLRILGIDPTTGTPVEEFVYLLQSPTATGTDPDVGFGSQEVDRIGDAVFIGDGQFLVIERDNEDTDDAQQFIVSVDLQGATNILGTELSNATEGTTLESLSPDELAAAGVQAVNTIQVTNLPSLGFSPTPQSEGLTLLPDGRLAVLNDNDYEGPENPTQLGIVGFGPFNGLDASDDDGGINIENEPVFGLFQPDSIAAFEIDGETFFITANEGDGRDDFENLTDIERISDLTLDPEAFPDAATLQLDENLGRLEVSTIDGDIDGDGDFDQLFAFGTRSFSIRDSLGNLVFDSGADFELITAEQFPDDFNSDNDENGSFDNRSDDGGPEPEGLAIGEVDGVLYAFIGLERIGGIAVYDISDPANSEFVQYVNNRDFTVDAELPDGTTNPAVGDLGPEGLAFISAEDSPTGEPLLAVGNEVSGTTTLFAISAALDGGAPDDDAVVVTGTAGDDIITGGIETDAINDILLTGSGADEIDLLIAGDAAGDNIVLSGSDIDAVFASVGDIISGGSGDDTLVTSAANGGNRIFGGAGDDTFIIEGSGDRLLGGAGNDTFIAGGGGDNIISGGEGADTFIVVDDAGVPAVANTITDFEAGTDILQVAASVFGEGDLSLEAGSSDIVLDGTVVASLTGVDVASLTVGTDIAFI